MHDPLHSGSVNKSGFKSNKAGIPAFLPKVLVLLLLVAAIGTAVYFYMQYRKLTSTQREVEELKVRLSKIMVLPDDAPTVATVADKDKLKDTPFFQKAENGDKVLIFQQGLKAVLYRPSSNKIIDVVGVNVEPNAANEPAAAGNATVETATITVLNSTSTSGLANSMEQELKRLSSQLIVKQKAQAKSTYPTTLVVDVAGNKQQLAADLAKQLNAQVATLPAGEATPNTDLVVIVGRDRQ